MMKRRIQVFIGMEASAALDELIEVLGESQTRAIEMALIERQARMPHHVVEEMPGAHGIWRGNVKSEPSPHPDSPTGRLLRNKANAGQLDPEVEQGQVLPVFMCNNCRRGIHIGHKADDGGCSNEACLCIVRIKSEPDAEQAVKDAHRGGAAKRLAETTGDMIDGDFDSDDVATFAKIERKAKKEARGKRKAELGESVKGALPAKVGAYKYGFPKPTRGGK